MNANNTVDTRESSNRRIRIGVLGGGFGRTFTWHKHPNSTVQAVCDFDSERREELARTYVCDTRYETYEQMLQDRSVDAVAICSGAPDHVRHTVAALRVDKHVFCAVPAAITLEECEELVKTVEETGLTYMMGETSYYRQAAISARAFYEEGRFGNIYYTEAEYHHAGLESSMYSNGQRTWRYALPPMLYPTHCTAFLTGTTGERLISVSCIGWGDDSPFLKNNQYGNPFCNETAFFKTDKANAFRASVFWKGAHRGTERAQWYGEKMSFFMDHPNGMGPVIVRSVAAEELHIDGIVRYTSELEPYEQPEYWQTDMLPEPLRLDSYHGASHGFLTHEFVDALINERRPAIDVYEAVAYTAPGIVAHQSALRGGEQMKIPSFDPKN